MRAEPVEIYSDASNAAVMRHPGRKFPGVLVQGDTLSILCRSADDICKHFDRDSDAYYDAAELRDSLQALLTHYKAVLRDHGIPLPFVDHGR